MVRVRLHEDDSGAANAYAQAVGCALDGVEGFRGYGVWQSVQDSLARMILFSYASDEAAAQGLTCIGERRSLVERQGYSAEPADVLGLHVVHAEGVFTSGVAQSFRDLDLDPYRGTGLRSRAGRHLPAHLRRACRDPRLRRSPRRGQPEPARRGGRPCRVGRRGVVPRLPSPPEGVPGSTLRAVLRRVAPS